MKTLILAAFAATLPAFAAGPVISAFALTPYSSSELLAAWTTSATADSTVECGTTSGTYTITSETVNPLARGYSVTDHSMTIAGLLPSTLYFCKVISVSAGGSTTSATELSATTNAVVAQKDIHVSAISAAVRYNDQYPINGRQMLGDSAYSAWAGDGNSYSSYQDGSLPNTGTGMHTIVFQWPTASDLTYKLATLTNALTNANGSGAWTDGRNWRTMGVFSIWDRASGTSILYDALFRGNTDSCCTSFIKSPDFGAHWVAPENNTGPGVVGNVNGDMPTPGNCMNCVADAGQNRYVPFVTCKDHNACQNTVANEGSYQYFFNNNTNPGLARVRLENATLQDQSKVQFYIGANSADDGNYPAAWQSAQPGQTLFTGGFSDIWPTAVFLPDFNEYLVTSWAGNPGAGDPYSPISVGIYRAKNPWSIKTLIATIPVPGTPAGYLPGFPQPQLATYIKTSSVPLTATIKMVVSGYYPGTGDPNTNNYSIFTYDLNLSEGPPATSITGKGSVTGKGQIQ